MRRKAVMECFIGRSAAVRRVPIKAALARLAADHFIVADRVLETLQFALTDVFAARILRLG